MAEFDEELRDILAESPRALAELFKSVSHEGRVKVLTLLLDGERDLAELVGGTGLSKNALVNHLKLLADSRLVERVSRGRYSLTPDGRDIIASAASLYRESAVREEEERERRQRRYAWAWKGVEMSERVVSNPAVYQPCWISYTGAVSGVLKSRGVDRDIVEVGGYTGYAFITNVIRGEFCPSGPTAFHIDVWGEMHRATSDLGYRVECRCMGRGYPNDERNPTPEELETTRALFEVAKKEIEADRPVVLWGLAVPEYGIVNGYKGNSYIASTFRRLAGQPETPIPYHELQAPGDLHALLFKEPLEVNEEEAIHRAVERAYRFASGDVTQTDRWITGPEAFTEWVNALENASPGPHSYHGNSYVAACLHEARQMAAGFLNRIASHTPSQMHLLKASEIYAESERLLNELHEMFPFSFQGEMPEEKRKKGADILRKVREIEAGAIEHLGKALEEW